MSSFKTNHFHRFVRHPSLSFLILGFWITPQMTVDRLLLAALMTIYTVLGAWSVDRKFLRYYGEDYARRQKRGAAAGSAPFDPRDARTRRTLLSQINARPVRHSMPARTSARHGG
jgi:hypothetical protein